MFLGGITYSHFGTRNYPIVPPGGTQKGTRVKKNCTPGIQLYPLKRGDQMPSLYRRGEFYYIRFRIKIDGKTQEKNFSLQTKNESQAQKLFKEADELYERGFIDPYSGWTPNELGLKQEIDRKNRHITISEAGKKFLINRPHIRIKTKQAYQRHFKLLESHLGKTMSIKLIRTDDIREICYRPELQPATKRSYITHFRAFFKWLYKEGYIDSDPTSEIKKPQVPENLSERFISKEAFEEILKAKQVYMEEQVALGSCKTEAQQQLWFSPLMTMLYYTGMRISEALRMEWTDILSDYSGLYIRNKRYAPTKSAKERFVPMRKPLFEALSLWREQNDYPKVGLIFPSVKSYDQNVMMSTHSVTKTFKKYVKLAGIGNHFRLHDLRHSCLTDLAKNGVDGHEIQLVAGHSDFKTTQKYLHLNNQDLIKTFSKLD